MARTAIDLGSVRAAEDSTTDLLQRAAEAGYDGAVLPPDIEDTAAVATKLDATGLATAGVRPGIDELERELNALQERFAGTLDAEVAVLPPFSPDHFATVRAVEHTAGRLTSLAHRLNDAGWRLDYSVGGGTFRELDDGTNAFGRFAAESDAVGLEFDTGAAFAAVRDPVALITEHAERVESVRLTDADAAGHTELGAGEVDLAACAAAAREANVSWLVHAPADPADPGAALDSGADALNGL
jgi:sugar phosphate isomerase/epimerase